MKKIYIPVLTLFITLFSCSSDSNGDPNPENPSTPVWAMTAKINGNNFQANNPFGNNNFSSTNIWTYFPLEDYVMLQGRQGGVFGAKEINIWLKRSDIVVGTYTIGRETFTTPPSHFINLIDLTNSIGEFTKEGVIEITEVNTTSHTVKGTFDFKTVDEINQPAAPVDFYVTEGKFNYKYE
ncbi:DUF6252 family protein [Flavobacterium sp.]|uniref:DUF6252 family protein n=1 Tax=Flavobacterium sp. TaxID=239 RepID=UPI0026131324|nr:DUF6252 family protein [Flavobacterium sp.]